MAPAGTWDTPGSARPRRLADPRRVGGGAMASNATGGCSRRSAISRESRSIPTARRGPRPPQGREQRRHDDRHGRGAQPDLRRRQRRRHPLQHGERRVRGVINGVSIGGPPWNNAALGPAMGVQSSSAIPTLGDFALIPQQVRPLLFRTTPTRPSRARTRSATRRRRGPSRSTRRHRAVRLGEPGRLDRVRLGLDAFGTAVPFRSAHGLRLQRPLLPRLRHPLVQLSFLQPAFAFATDANGVVNVTIPSRPGSRGSRSWCSPSTSEPSASADRLRSSSSENALRAGLPVRLILLVATAFGAGARGLPARAPPADSRPASKPDAIELVGKASFPETPRTSRASRES